MRNCGRVCVLKYKRYLLILIVFRLSYFSLRWGWVRLLTISYHLWPVEFLSILISYMIHLHLYFQSSWPHHVVSGGVSNEGGRVRTERIEHRRSQSYAAHQARTKKVAPFTSCHVLSPYSSACGLPLHVFCSISCRALSWTETTIDKRRIVIMKHMFTADEAQVLLSFFSYVLLYGPIPLLYSVETKYQYSTQRFCSGLCVFSTILLSLSFMMVSVAKSEQK